MPRINVCRLWYTQSALATLAICLNGPHRLCFASAGLRNRVYTTRRIKKYEDSEIAIGSCGPCCQDQSRARYFSRYFIMTGFLCQNENGLRHFLWLCTSESHLDLGKEQQDIWIWYIFLCLWGPFVLFQISAVQRGRRERKIVRKRQVEGGGEVGLIYVFRVSHF